MEQRICHSTSYFADSPQSTCHGEVDEDLDQHYQTWIRKSLSAVYQDQVSGGNGGSAQAGA